MLNLVLLPPPPSIVEYEGTVKWPDASIYPDLIVRLFGDIDASAYELSPGGLSLVKVKEGGYIGVEVFRMAQVGNTNFNVGIYATAQCDQLMTKPDGVEETTGRKYVYVKPRRSGWLFSIIVTN